MEWMSLNTLREKYLAFFESKGHLRLDSFSLVPNNDKSLLLINSGMAPMKKYFTGEVTPPRNRVTTCQKCIRTPDLERVGHTARHGTYFEMLGNFSFGDYFKNEAIPWAWEFLTKTLEIPEDKLWPSVYEEDDEAYNLWKDVIGVPEERIVKLGKADNFWEHGTGPCGPCSEIYFDRGEKYGCGSPDCKPGCECDRYMEIWNNVFSQFNNKGDGTYEELASKNIDTGMGLERLACVMQGVDNMFEVDTVRNILNKVCEIADKEYGKDKENDISIRVITDHVRASTFMICDGIMPSNEGRGYVLRRLLRRAARHGRLLGITRAFLNEVCDVVINENKGAYSELVEKTDFIKKIIQVEESNFAKTIDQGLKLIEEIVEKAETKTVSGADAFKLSDTYGFPIDLTKDILEEKGFSVDEDEFNRLMDEQKQRARNSRKADEGEAWKGESNLLNDVAETEFLGYTQNEIEARVLAIVKDNERVDSVIGEGKVIVVLNKTPFYAESGGQVGDTGVISTKDGSLSVLNTVKNQNGLFTHICELNSGIINVGDKVNAAINVERRMKIRRNHTAAHLLQAALRSVLGTHVEQAGQLVNENEVRFDFTHFSALSYDEISKVENWVNDVILSGIEVQNDEMPIEEAKKLGAMSLFGEKYGAVVRVVNVKDKSIEFCGGTHIDNTAKLGLFKITSESSVASGVRRITAVTACGVLELLNNSINTVEKIAKTLKLNNKAEIINRAEQLMSEIKEKEKAIDALNAKIALSNIGELLENAKQVGAVKLIACKLNSQSSDAVRNMCDVIKDKEPDSVCVIANITQKSATIAVAAGKGAIEKGLHSGKIVGAVAAIAGGKGGGRPDFAMAGAKDVSKIDEALNSAEQIVSSFIKL